MGQRQFGKIIFKKGRKSGPFVSILGVGSRKKIMSACGCVLPVQVECRLYI